VDRRAAHGVYAQFDLDRGWIVTRQRSNSRIGDLTANEMNVAATAFDSICERPSQFF